MRCRWTSDKWICVELRPILTVTLGLWCRVAMWRILGKYSIRILLTHQQFCLKTLYFGKLSNHVNLSSHAMFDCGFSFTFPKHNTESENTKTFVCKRLMTYSSPTKDKYFHKEYSQLISLRSRLIVRSSVSQICRTSVSLWDLLYFWGNSNCLSNSSPWIQMLAMWKT